MEVAVSSDDINDLINRKAALLAEKEERLADLDKEIAAALLEKKKAVQEAILKLVDESGFTLGQLFGDMTRRKAVRGETFVDPTNPEKTWNGVGRMPIWLRDKLNAGHSLDDFKA